MKVCFETFGCRLNLAEALEEEAKYLARGWELTEKHSDADLFVIRGCSVTRRAQHDCERLIEHLKRKYPDKQVIVQGCLEKKRDQMVPLAINKMASSATPRKDTPPVPTRTSRAYLKVQDGCSGNCTFCIVPSFRGKSTSTDYDSTIDKAKRFIEAGYHEIVVTGCNLSLYASEGKRLPELLDALSSLDPDVRIRLGSLEPGKCALEVVQVMASKANMCRMLHLPIQSGSNMILAAMRRPYMIRDVEEVIRKATSLMPNIGLGCDIITGFPGETDLDFDATRGLFLRHTFSNAHIFPYSKRPGTLAAAFPNEIPRELRSRRAHELADIAKEKRTQFANKFIGQKVQIIVENAEKVAGWTSEYLWCENVVPNKNQSTPLVARKSTATMIVQEVTHGMLRGKII